MSILDLYDDFGIHGETEGSKHCRDGWVNVECPFCTGNPGLHLGCHIASGIFSCWRCGGKPTQKAIAKLVGCSPKKAKELIRKYRVRKGGSKSSKEAKIVFKPLHFPSDCGIMSVQHKRYLDKRGFDAHKLEYLWGLLGTGPVAFLDDISYKHRILAPIIWQGQTVSFQTRDITDRANIKYMACPKLREKIHHQHILYGAMNWNKYDTIIIVEGITDVWRIGMMAFATFGIDFTNKQVRIIAKLFKHKRVIILYDDDPQAIIAGNTLKAELRFRGVETHQEIIKGDPGAMTQINADYLVKQLLKRRF